MLSQVVASSSAVAERSAEPTVHFTASLLAANRLVVSTYWTDDERVSAARRLEGAHFRRADGKRLAKLKRTEYKRKRALLELLDVHARFLGHVDVLANVWRAALREMMAADEDATSSAGGAGGAALVDSIFPSLDTIQSVSQARLLLLASDICACFCWLRLASAGFGWLRLASAGFCWLLLASACF